MQAYWRFPLLEAMMTEALETQGDPAAAGNLVVALAREEATAMNGDDPLLPIRQPLVAEFAGVEEALPQTAGAWGVGLPRAQTLVDVLLQRQHAVIFVGLPGRGQQVVVLCVGQKQQAEVRVSMNGKGRALDNCFVERLWRSVKYAEVYLHDYASPREARRPLAGYFDFYNDVRPHQSLDYRTPAQVYSGAIGAAPQGGGSRHCRGPSHRATTS